MTTMTPIPEFDERSLAAIRSDPDLAAWFELRTAAGSTGLSNFRPRPDDPARFDEQSSFVFNRDTVSFFLKGNAAGGTEAAAFKTARFLLQQQPPPRPDTPFWIISDNQTQCVDVCWGEKLYGHGYIPDCEIDWPRVEWYSAKGGRPRRVPLRPWPADRGGDPAHNWVLDFRSYAEGRASMQARSIGGFWFSEQFPWDLFIEVLRGCRDYMFPGGQFCEFTPIDPGLCEALSHLMADPPPGYRFYRGSTEANRPNLAAGWYEQFVATLPEETRATRLTGALASYEGAIYPTFSPLVHVGKDEDFVFPPGAEHFRSVDWGDSEKHATVCLWGFAHRGEWRVYDEYWSNDQTRITVDHAAEVLARSIAWGWPVPEAVAKPGEATRYLAAQVRSRLAELAPGGARARPDQRHGYSYADPENLAQVRTFCRYGIPCVPAVKNVLEGIDEVRAHLKTNPFTGRPRVLIHPRCRHLIDELPRYRWDPKATARGKPVKADDDAADAFRYLLYSHARAQPEAPSAIARPGAGEGRTSVQLRRLERR